MLKAINKDTQLCISLSGRPGNFGTRFQNYLYGELGLNFVYKAFTTQDIRGAITGIRALGIRGCAVSMPFKEACIPLVDEMDATAQGIESVNTIVNNRGKLTAYNTDYAAIVKLLGSRDVSPKLEFAVLGSGGMAKAVICALKDQGFKRGTLVSRNEKTGKSLAERYGYHLSNELGDRRPRLLINATPIGMQGGREADELAFSKEAVAASEVIFDVVALPAETPLIRLASSLKKKVISGADVIVLQAVDQFVLYTGVRPQAELIEKAAVFARSAR